jgi:hypothetical protein
MDAPLHPLAERFAWIITWFNRSMGLEVYRRRGVEVPGLAVGSTYVQRLGRRFAALVARWQAGTLPVPGVVRKRPAAARASQPRPKAPIPKRLGWLHKVFPDSAPMFGGNLSDLLHGDPNMMALAAATPLAGRLLRPMCWALGMKPPEYLQLPTRPRKPRPTRPPRTRKPKVVNSMSRMAWANFVNPEDEGEHDPRALRPPNRIGYGRQKPLIKPG